MISLGSSNSNRYKMKTSFESLKGNRSVCKVQKDKV